MKKTAQLRKMRGQGFTLVELLVVIAIIAILAAVVILVINPVELTKRGRDATRLSDLANLQQAINITVQEATGSSVLCNGTPGACGPFNSKDGTRAVNGTGWVSVDLTKQKAISIPVLPVDPVNDATYNYSYQSDGASYEIDAVLESDQQKDKMTNDGGDNPNKYEVGTKLTIIN